ncbi:acetyltransferase [Raoultella ornithinolytica]|uniref:acetyltransferase n=1 Tax=Raoultella ornithinolytica TaxID=54291 RepID=UPI00292B0180|nr:acetyltransferase [Raoultella ornithinolytica]MDV0598531.1 acetyltransferase [Raoultella ornithinolytica]
MKAANTFFCLPSELPTVRAMIGDAVLEIIRSGAPVGAAGLLTLLKSPGARKNWSDEGPLLQIAIDALEESLSIDFKKI